MRLLYLFTLIILTGLTDVSGNSSGPPAGACSSMVPSHGGSAQSSASPYSVSFSKSTYSANEQIQVTLQGSPDFKGFLIQPRKSSSDTTTYGSITGPANTQNPCSGITALSHNSNAGKSSVTFTWTAPATDEGAIVFVYTTVQAQATYWVKEVSSAINYQASSGTTQTSNTGTTTQTPTTTQSTGTVGALRKPDNCGDVGCYDDCSDDVCNFVVTWLDNGGNSVTFTLSCLGTGNRYCAMGLSSDERMGDDSVIACVSDGSTVEVRHFYNNGRSNEPLDNPTFGLTLVSSSHDNNVISCTFTRVKTAALASSSGRKKRAVSDATTFFDLNDDWILMYADGSYSSGFLSKHTNAPKVSCIKADFQSTADLAICSPTLVYVHATFMVLAWMFLTSFGIITARYYKTVWSEGTELCGEKRWFAIHRFTMVLVLLFNIIGFTVIFVHVDGYSKISGSGFEKSHPVIGIIVMVFTVINPMMALIRPKPGTKYRPVFNVTHLIVGEVAYILALINVFSGTLLSTTNVPSHIRIVLYVYEAWVIGLEVFLWIHEYCTKKDRNQGSRSKVGDFTANTEDQTRSNNGSQTNRSPNKEPFGWKSILLVVHGTMLLGFTIAFVVIVWTHRDN